MTVSLNAESVAVIRNYEIPIYIPAGKLFRTLKGM
jgi:hypothetical protein